MPSHIICISGPEGVGKDTLMTRVIEQFPQLTIGKKVTTRAARPDDYDESGQSKYDYVDEAKFWELFASGEVAEFSRNANGCLYGARIESETSGVEIRDIDVLGARQLVALSQMLRGFPQVTAIGILPPEAKSCGIHGKELIELFRAPMERQERMKQTLHGVLLQISSTLEARLLKRGDSDDVRIMKLQRASWEIPLILRTWPTVIFNDDVDRAANVLTEIVATIHRLERA